MSAVRRLTGNEHLGFEFATEWSTYELDERTRALLAYAAKLTDYPSALEDADIEKAWAFARNSFKAFAAKVGKQPGFSGYLVGGFVSGGQPPPGT